MKWDGHLHCHNCGTKFPITHVQERRLRRCVHAFNDAMGELGMPRWMEGDNPLLYLDTNVNCCVKPDIHWFEQTE